MLKVDLSHAEAFLPLPYDEELLSPLKTASEQLQNGGGAGDDFIGWVHWPENYDKEEYKRIKCAAKKIQSDSKALVVIGIGGSYLGARGVIDCLKSPNYNLKKKDTPNIYFAGNTLSNNSLTEIMELIGDDDFSINVISKSGTTTEPAVTFRFFREILEKKYGKKEAAGRIYATTDTKSGALRTMADREGYETFVVPGNIGGRYSVLTAVGLLPIAVSGIDIDQLMAGAKDMMEHCKTESFENQAWCYAAARHELYRFNRKIELLVSYEPAFTSMIEWWKQLYGESEGKNNRGVFPAGVTFPTDLHSMGQYIQQGERTLWETLVRFTPNGDELCVPFDEDNLDGMNFLAGKNLAYVNQQAMDGTLLAHTEGGVPNIVLECGKLCERTVGELIYFFEYACGLSGYLLGINPFDQPGVENYKRNMFALLNKPGYEKMHEIIARKLNR